MRVISVPKAIAEKFIIAKHYSRRPSVFWEAFGLVECGMVVGVVVYGQPSPPIQRYAFRDRDFRLYELTRLVVQTSTKNAASMLIGRSLQMLSIQPAAVISYADTEHAHAGIVYQATNWIYTGSTVSHDKAYIIDGKRTHPMTLRDRGITDPGRWAKEHGIETLPPMEKHRYFYFVGNKRQKREMAARLVYPVVDGYPKCNQQRYDDGPQLHVPAPNMLFDD